MAVPTMLAATCLEVLKMILAGEFDDMSGNISTLLIGSLVSFVVAILAMKWFVSFIAKYGFKLFGWSASSSDCSSWDCSSRATHSKWLTKPG